MNPLDHPCRIWSGAKNDSGYPQKRHNGKTTYVHRLAYETLRGPIPEGLELDHLCRTPACYEPLHLEAVTHLENVRRGIGNQYKDKTHCQRGHEFTPENTRYVPSSPKRQCRACEPIRRQRWLERHPNYERDKARLRRARNRDTYPSSLPTQAPLVSAERGLRPHLARVLSEAK